MPEEIAKANIEHFKKLLQTETSAPSLSVCWLRKSKSLLRSGSGAREKRADGVIPFPPMARMHVNRRAGLGAYPTVKNTATRKHERMYFIGIDNRQLEIAPERRGCYRLPLHGATMRLPFGFGVDFHQYRFVHERTRNLWKCKRMLSWWGLPSKFGSFA
jgi:hypothetical protein